MMRHCTARWWLALLLFGAGCSRPTVPSEGAEKAASQTAREPPPPPPLQCEPGSGDCNGDRSDGCETALRADPDNCGACGKVCGEASRCLSGGCRTGAVAVSAGGSHSCLLTVDGRVACWGLNALGQLGLPKRHARLSPVLLPEPSDAQAVAAGRYHTCVLRAGGELGCTGDGGVLGSDSDKPQAGMRAVSGVDGAVAVSAGISHSCAVTQKGKVYCWGSDVNGQLGNGPPPPEAEDDDDALFSKLPVMVAGVDDAIGVAVGGARSCVLHRAGTVSCWGQGALGRFGHAPREDRHQPAPVEGLQGVVQLSMGQFHTCALTRQDALYCWGRNAWGQLGLGDRDDRQAPTQLPLSQVAEVSAGTRHTCARTRDGAVLCWGDNRGQLGDGTAEIRLVPTAVKGLTGTIAIAAGDAHSCAVKGDGTLWCWGDNDGQLGDGTRAPRLSPVAVSWPPPAAALAPE